MSERVKLTSIEAGKSFIELERLAEIKKLVDTEIQQNKDIIENHLNLEFKIDEDGTFELDADRMYSIHQQGYSEPKIQDLVVRKSSGNQAVLFIRRSTRD